MQILIHHKSWLYSRGCASDLMLNRELMFRVIAYNMHRLTVFMVWFLQSRYNNRCTYCWNCQGNWCCCNY